MARMRLPVMPPVKPMLAKATTWAELTRTIAGGQHYEYQPKWDGFCRYW